MRKLIGIFVTLCVLLSLMALPVSAATGQQDGLTVTLETDRESYAPGEQVELVITVTNSGRATAENICLELLLPEGLVLSGEAPEVFDLPAGSSRTLRLIALVTAEEIATTAATEVTAATEATEPAARPEPTNPKTGDDFSLLLWVLLGVAALGGLAALVIWGRHRTVVGVICLVLCGGMVLGMVPAYAASLLTVSETVTLAGGEAALTVKLTWQLPGETARFTVRFENARVEAQQVLPGGCCSEPEDPTREGWIFAGWYENDTPFDFSTPIHRDVTLTAHWLDATDTDGDGIPDEQERVIGTDPESRDTDGDGLSDLFEPAAGTDPLTADTDGNGVSDGDEDGDGDGMVCIEEQRLGCDPASRDTDGDGLADGEEQETDPLDRDTDGDGASDGDEVALGTDPLTADASFTVEAATDSASVVLEVTGEQVGTLSVTETAAITPETPGYMGQACDFSISGSFSSATISFAFDPAALESGAMPTIYHLNEQTGLLEEQATTVTDGVASATVTHFSQYVLLDRTRYEESFHWVDVWESGGGYSSVELVLVVDDSGSMYENDYYDQRLTVAAQLIGDLPVGSRVGLVGFAGSSRVYSPLTHDTEGVQSMLHTGNFRAYGTTYMYEAISDGLALFGEEAEVLRVLVVLSDGEADDTRRHGEIIDAALAKGVKVFSVGLGTDSAGYFQSYLKPLAHTTGGEFYLASDADQLSGIYANISQKIDLNADSDYDGIPDYYEDHMVGFDGRGIPLDKYNADTDGDTIPDGEELVVKRSYNHDRSRVRVTGVLVLGDPTKPDTDGDSYWDNVDYAPFLPYKKPVVLLHGLNSNSVCFGVVGSIGDGENKGYGSRNPGADTSAAAQRILRVEPGKLGGYLTATMGYTPNGNLFALNYPNGDVVQYNAVRLGEYLDNLAASGKAKDGAVDERYLFATKEDQKQGRVDFILVGHSMGGLVARFYLENLGGDRVDRLITICTPHYGSGLASLSDTAADLVKFSPAIVDLRLGSLLFGGSRKLKTFLSLSPIDAVYAIVHQSPELKGNAGLSVPYYFIAGYDVGQITEIHQLPLALQGTVFGTEFNREVSSKAAYKDAINRAVAAASQHLCGRDARLDLGGSDGDQTVNHTSQLGVRFGLTGTDVVAVERTAIVVNPLSNTTVVNPYHNGIHSQVIMHRYVAAYILDGDNP